MKVSMGGVIHSEGIYGWYDHSEGIYGWCDP